MEVDFSSVCWFVMLPADQNKELSKHFSISSVIVSTNTRLNRSLPCWCEENTKNHQNVNYRFVNDKIGYDR